MFFWNSFTAEQSSFFNIIYIFEQDWVFLATVLIDFGNLEGSIIFETVKIINSQQNTNQSSCRHQGPVSLKSIFSVFLISTETPFIQEVSAPYTYLFLDKMFKLKMAFWIQILETGHQGPFLL